MEKFNRAALRLDQVDFKKVSTPDYYLHFHYVLAESGSYKFSKGNIYRAMAFRELCCLLYIRHFVGSEENYTRRKHNGLIIPVMPVAERQLKIMKILIVSDSLSGGGAEKLINDLAPRIKEKGHDVDILVLTKKNEKYIENLTSHEISVVSIDNISGHLRRIIFIRKKIKKEKYDLVHVNLFPSIYYVALASLFLGGNKPALIMTEHNTDNRRRHIKQLRPVERFIYRRFNKIISISAMTQKQLKDWLRLPQKDDYRFKVVDNGIPVCDFTEAEPYEKRELFPSVQPGDILLGMVGSFSIQKNHTAMLEILKFLPSNYKLICAGEGPLLSEIQEKAERCGLSDRIAFLGFRKDAAQVMHTVDIVVIPSIWEGFGLVAAEAMACGKPVVASNVPGLAEVVGQYGLLGDVNDPEGFAGLIQTLEDKHTYNFFSEQASQRAEDFNIEKTVREYENIYLEASKDHA